MRAPYATAPGDAGVGKGGASYVRTPVLATAWLMMTGLLLVLAPRPASAHAELMKSSPANGAAYTSTPSAIRAWFSEELAASGSYLRLYDAHNKMLATGSLDPSNREALRLVPPHLSPGNYVVRWHVVSADDNHVTQGSFRFSIGGAAVAPPTVTTPPASAKTPSSLPPLQIIAPVDHGSVTNPVALVIQTPGDIKQLTMGGTQMSGMGSMGASDARVHLHILVDGATIMPSSEQLKALGNDRYQYTLAPLSPGAHTIKVFWADDKTHQPAGPVRAATCTVGP
jgi:methionine-rich copper-binding protein CopC